MIKSRHTFKKGSVVVIETPYEAVVIPELSAGAILNEGFPGFREDYLLLHCLMRREQPARVMEIGTNIGNGTTIIKNAVPEAEVFSLDLPPDQVHKSLIRSDGSCRVGSACRVPYTQLWGDSRTFDFEPYAPLDAWFIDGNHVYENVFIESELAQITEARLIVWHDCDIKGVWRGVTDAMRKSDFDLHRVPDTRIGFALRR
jgi:predicted O-methyltransferase YrrM